MDTGSHSPLGLGRSAAKRAKWRAQYLKNREARSVFNSTYKGEIKGLAKLAEYHAGIKALSMGTV